jgi:hypothetical protein
MDLLLWLFIGILGGNAVPHLVKGITKESYPCALGNGPVPNFIGGWLSFVLASAESFRDETEISRKAAKKQIEN